MKIKIIAVSLLCLSSSFADRLSKEFEKLNKAGDKNKTEEFLKKAEKKETRNPNYYAIAGNYWWGQAKGGTIQINPIPAGNFEIDPKNLEITDPKTGKRVGKIGPSKKSDSEEGRRALGILSEGAKKFPHRADLAFGLAHLQKESQMLDESAKTIIALLKHAKKSPRSLKWMNDEKLPKPADKFLPESIQPYSSALFNANTPKTDRQCKELLDEITKTFPDHPYAYNMKAALADAQKKPAEALKMLEIAHSKAPEDHLILSNLAATYAKQRDKRKAIMAYQKLLKLKLDPSRKREAEKALQKLKK